MSDQQEKTVTRDAAERAVRVGQLLDLYGPLLTDRQRLFMQLHYAEDLSFGEVAREYGVSRQAVHDAVRHAERALEDYDAKLGFSPDQARRRPEGEAEATPAAPVAVAEPASIEGLAPCIDSLSEIEERLRRSGGIIYNAEGIAREVGEVLERLKRLQGTGNGE